MASGPAKTVIYLALDGTARYASIGRPDPDAGEVDFQWDKKCEELGTVWGKTQCERCRNASHALDSAATR